MTRELIAVLLDWDSRHPGGAWKGACWRLTGNAAILAAHGKARASGWKGAKPLRMTDAWAGTPKTPKTPRNTPAWCASLPCHHPGGLGSPVGLGPPAVQ